MRIIYFSSDKKNRWNVFVKKNAFDGGLLQSWQWGNFQASLKKKIWRIGVVNKHNDLLAVCLAFQDSLSLGQKTIEIYRGPIISREQKTEAIIILKLLLKELKKIANKQKAITVRMDFGIQKDNNFKFTKNNLQQLNLFRANRDIQPRSTIFIDLEKDSEKILQEMKSKHRYNIRLAQRKGVKVIQASSHKENFEKFWELMQMTAKRDNFAIHNKDYYWQLLNKTEEKIKLYLAFFEDKIVATSLIGCFGQVCVYLHGASDSHYKNVMAPYLLQWQAILDIQKKKKKYYDLGGIKSKEENSSSQKGWSGITRFKKGFSPESEVIEFLGLWNLPLNKFKYDLYNFLRFLVKILRKIKNR